jgi:hypothetical protein
LCIGKAKQRHGCQKQKKAVQSRGNAPARRDAGQPCAGSNSGSGGRRLIAKREIHGDTSSKSDNRPGKPAFLLRRDICRDSFGETCDVVPAGTLRPAL